MSKDPDFYGLGEFAIGHFRVVDAALHSPLLPVLWHHEVYAFSRAKKKKNLW